MIHAIVILEKGGYVLHINKSKMFMIKYGHYSI